MGVLIRRNGHTCGFYLQEPLWLTCSFCPENKKLLIPAWGRFMWAQEVLLWSLWKKEFISLLHFIHLFLPVLQYPLKEQIHLRMFILSWYSGLESFSICFCPAFDITFCRWQHLSESHCRLLTGFVPSDMGCVHHHCNFTEMGGMTPWINLSHHHKCFLKYHHVLWAQWLCLGWPV